MLRNIEVNGKQFMMRSRDGKSWFSNPSSMLAASRRKAELPEFTKRDYRRIDQMVEVFDGAALLTGADMRSAIRFHFFEQEAN